MEMYASSFYAGLIGTDLSDALACTDAELIVFARRERVHLVGLDEWREEVCPWCERDADGTFRRADWWVGLTAPPGVRARR